MADSDGPTDAPALPEIIERVDSRSPTLTLYNVDTDDVVLADIQSYFDVQSVTLRRATTDDARPRNFVVLHDGDQFLGAAGLKHLYSVIRPDSELLDVSNPEEIEYPDLLRKITQNLFTNYGRRRMTVASREIEEYAYRNGGAVHAGFQELSNFRTQYRLYGSLADAGVETHLYGAPDWQIPTDAHALHEYDDDEITGSWFVVLDGDDEDKRALLAEERRENEFFGFWTFDASIVDTILARLDAYPATTPSAL
ncbi:DICT sensory domain-containing protein [Halobacterium litoreum]|uniref:DICT sensory domain-containing protein n=1 Tax=Halobacterium litoreum TaxID=2039234 RepID=A0ABD5NCG4_9EURY|nr:DICT sensory domain-containing protein [Halobacterium litoreum]UHH14316.1 hypothetical protein LT972_04780 [Halobacterium litoreum]